MSDLLEILNYNLASESAKQVNKFLVIQDKRPYQCSVYDCSRNGYAGGLCNAHYIRLRLGKSMDIPIRNRKRNDLCSECGVKTNKKGGWGLCTKHYKSFRNRVIKETIVRYLGGHCKMCNKVFPTCCYDLHHKDPSIKEGSMAKIMNNWSTIKIAKEVLKCELLCANCHRIKHSLRDDF